MCSHRASEEGVPSSQGRHLDTLCLHRRRRYRSRRERCLVCERVGQGLHATDGRRFVEDKPRLHAPSGRRQPIYDRFDAGPGEEGGVRRGRAADPVLGSFSILRPLPTTHSHTPYDADWASNKRRRARARDKRDKTRRGRDEERRPGMKTSSVRGFRAEHTVTSCTS